MASASWRLKRKRAKSVSPASRDDRVMSVSETGRPDTLAGDAAGGAPFVARFGVTLGSSELNTGSANTASAFGAGWRSVSSRRSTANTEADGKLTIS